MSSSPLLRQFSSEAAPPPSGPYSQAVEAGGLLFLSGQIGLKPDVEGLPEGVEDQAVQVLKNLEAVLHAANSTTNKVAKVAIYLVDLGDFSLVNEIYKDFFGEHRPARVCVGVASLPLGAKVEMDFIALAS
ncbi:MAG TPA: hypothetical protein DDW23_07865 [Planctomycetes bacterium]|nr:hypothetical protein [Planctomycetota bacterium]|tara:strand:+ start:208 stop:600 length:393 start_codon:yes stop_codon:yes gene_type:complete